MISLKARMLSIKHIYRQSSKRTIILVPLLLVTVIYAFYSDANSPRHIVQTARGRFISYIQVGNDSELQDLTDANGNYPPGDMGKPVVIEDAKNPDVKKQIDAGWALTGMNQYASDLVSVFRRLPDFRDNWCKQPGRYLSELPPTSIVIIFFNEAWSVVVRTVHSVLNRSPPELVEEIILVDDASNLAHLKTQLDDYFRPYKKVKIIRTGERLGLIRARLLGAKSAKAEVVTFLDAHCEVTTGWLEALLDPVARDPTAIAIPSIDLINGDSMVPYVAETYYGTFDWTLDFLWKTRSWRNKTIKNYAEPFDTPVMAGGVFSINKTFFAHLGWYDEGFDVYGGEHLELSFKAWMCGGSMQIIPCSRVTHMQKLTHPYIANLPGGSTSVKRNKIRLAEVWMDEYAQYYYESFGGAKLRGDFGEVSARKRLRDQLKCKSFRWFMETVFPEQVDPAKALGRGEFRPQNTTLCLDFPSPTNAITVQSCHGQGGHQWWFFTAQGEILRSAFGTNQCLDWNGSKLTMFTCHRLRGNQLWAYEANERMLRHVKFFACLEVEGAGLKMSRCDTSNANQKWTMQYYNASNLIHV